MFLFFLLDWSQPESYQSVSQVQKRMLDAIIAIEKFGINQNTVTSFRQEVAMIASVISTNPEVVTMLEGFDIRLTPATPATRPKKNLDYLSPSTDLEVGDDIQEVTGAGAKLEPEAEESHQETPVTNTYSEEHLVPVLSQVMHKVASRLASNSHLSGRKQVILVGSGAYNPIHKLHLRMLYIARKYLEERTE